MDANVSIALSQLLATVNKQQARAVLFHICKTFLTCLDLFDQGVLEEYTETVIFYIKWCADNVTVDKCIQRFPYQNPG